MVVAPKDVNQVSHRPISPTGVILDLYSELTAERRCAGPCGKLLPVQTGYLLLPHWTCPKCIQAAESAEAHKRWLYVKKFGALRKKHAFDLRAPGYPWRKVYA